MSEPVVRPLTLTDGPAARALARSVYGGTRYLTRTLELVEFALRGDDPDCLGLVGVSIASIHGLLLHGPVAGASGVIKVHALIASAPKVLTSMLSVLRDVISVADARMIVCELPGGAEHSVAAAALIKNGFTREGSVSGFFAEDIALGLFVWRRSEHRA